MSLDLEYIFYIDVFFLQNFLLKFTVVYLTLWFQHLLIKVSGIRMLVVVLLGIFLEIVFLLSGIKYHIIISFLNLLELPVMLYIILRRAQYHFFRVSMTAYFFTLVINGIVEILWNMFGRYGHYFLILFLSCVFCVFITKYIIWIYKFQKGIYPIELYNQGRIINTYGLYDTGNGLKEPYSSKAVHIISEEICQLLMLDKEKGLLVPYTSLGEEKGLIQVYYIDKMLIRKEQEMVELEDVAIGVTKDNLFEGKKYKVILNESIW